MKKKTRSKTADRVLRRPAGRDLVEEIRERACQNERKIGAEMGRVLRAALKGVSLSEAELDDAQSDRARMKSLERLVEKLQKQKKAEGRRA